MSDIVAERNIIIDPDNAISDSLSLNSIFSLFERILQRSKSTGQITLVPIDSDAIHRVPIQFLFEVLYGLISIIQDLNLYQKNTIEVSILEYKFSPNDLEQSIIISHSGLSLVPSGIDQISNANEDLIIGSLDYNWASRLIWLSNYITSQYHGHYRIVRSDEGKDRINVSYTLEP